MKTILIYGNNKISTFLHTAFGEAGIISVDITNQINSLDDPKDIYAILDVSNADISPENYSTNEAKDLIDLASKINSPYIFIYRDNEEINSESFLVTAIDFVKTYSTSKNINFTTIQVEDIYGTEINTSKKLEEYVNSITSGATTLSVDSDENEHYLIHQKDFMSGLKEIIRVMNSSEARGRKYYTLYPEDPITEIELAHFIKDLTDIELELTYSHEDTQTSSVLPDAETIYPDSWYPTVKLEEGLLDMFDYYGIPIAGNAEDEIEGERLRFEQEFNEPEDPFDKFDNDTENFDAEDEFSSSVSKRDIFDEYESEKFDYADIVPTPANNQTPKTKVKKPGKIGRKTKKAIASLTAALLFAFALPSFVFAYNIGMGLMYLDRASENINSVNLTSAFDNSQKAIGILDGIDKIPFPVSQIAKLAGINSNDQYLFLETTKEIAHAIHYLSGIDLYATLKSLDESTLAEASNSNVLGVSTVAEPEYIDKSLEKIEKIDNNLENLETRNGFIRDKISLNLASLNKNKEKLTKVKNIEPALGNLLGYNKKQTYLLLLQNVNIARSSGGRVEAFGILTAENGKLSIEKLQKSSEAHDQISLNGQIPAPLSIAAITDQDLMFMEDITWQPDFEETAKLASQLYSYIGDEDLDGVIAIDTNVMGNLIDTIGQAKVGEKSFNSEEFNNLLTTPNRQEIVKETFVYIFETLSSNQESFKLLEPILYSALNERHMMIFHKNESVYTSLVKNNWSGILKNVPSDEYLFIANNNLTDIPSQKILAEITYEGEKPNDDTGFNRVIEIRYTNNADADYLGHLMALLPKDTLLISAELSGDNGTKNIIRSVRNSIFGSSKALYETDLYIPTKQSLTLKMEFQSPPQDYKDDYIDITLQKQPGTGDIPLAIKLIGDNTMNTNVIFDGDKELKFPL